MSQANATATVVEAACFQLETALSRERASWPAQLPISQVAATEGLPRHPEIPRPDPEIARNGPCGLERSDARTAFVRSPPRHARRCLASVAIHGPQLRDRATRPSGAHPMCPATRRAAPSPTPRCANPHRGLSRSITPRSCTTSSQASSARASCQLRRTIKARARCCFTCDRGTISAGITIIISTRAGTSPFCCPSSTASAAAMAFRRPG